MSVRFGATDLGPEEQAALRRARRLQIASLVYLTTAVVLVFLVMGNSQAMRVAWIEDLLSFLPPLVFLVATRITRRKPSHAYPYGHHRAVGAAHLAASLALLALGGFLLVESAITLIRQEHPTIGTVNLLGQQVWQGWLMIAVLAYTGLPNAVLGRLKLPLAEKLHDKVLSADADMNKADWMTAGGAILGILGIGLGLWWADAGVALLISASIVKDGVENVRNAVAGLLDRTARTYDDAEEHPLVGAVDTYFGGLPWVGEVRVRMRDLGHVFHTEVLVVPRGAAVDLAELRRARDEARGLDWKLDDLVVVPCREPGGARHGGVRNLAAPNGRRQSASSSDSSPARFARAATSHRSWPRCVRKRGSVASRDSTTLRRPARKSSSATWGWSSRTSRRYTW